jgi:LppP/LprE lipoprotein
MAIRSVTRSAIVSGLVVLLFVHASATSSDAQPGGSWLDQATAQPWNLPGAPPPDAPAPDTRTIPVSQPLCATAVRPPSNSMERALATAGWTISAIQPPQVFPGNIVAITATAAFVDLRCGLAQYQTFVFKDGQFIGTISPNPMSSRQDGSGEVVNVDGMVVRATYQRYLPSDPLCCPSSHTDIDFTIQNVSGAFVLALGSTPDPTTATASPNASTSADDGPRTLSAQDEQARQKAAAALGVAGSGTLLYQVNFADQTFSRLEATILDDGSFYGRPIDDIKLDVVAYLKGAFGFTDRGLCDLPLVFTLDPSDRAALEEAGTPFDSTLPGCD